MLIIARQFLIETSLSSPYIIIIIILLLLRGKNERKEGKVLSTIQQYSALKEELHYILLLKSKFQLSAVKPKPK